ncbi:MAG: LptF/LptG family permease [Candidatus Hydrogenedentes bacterium]|nr:LptF/LptG family permease [Candidatus Hydrogenedentota bacterium]
MSLLNRYILRSIAVPAAMAFVVVTFLGAANELRERSAEIQLGHFRLSDLGLLAMFFMPTLIPILIPAAYMMGILLVYGRMAQNNEITAMKAAGIPVRRIVTPVIVVGGILSAVSFLLQDRVQPIAQRMVNHKLYVELPQRLTLDVLPAGQTHEIGGWYIYVGAKDAQTQTLHDVYILEPQDGGETMVFYAKSAILSTVKGRHRITLRDGHIIPPDRGGNVARSTFPEWNIYLPEAEALNIPNRIRTLTITELYAQQRLVEFADALRERGLWDGGMIDTLLAAQGDVQAMTAVPAALKSGYTTPLRVQPDWIEPLRTVRPDKMLEDIYNLRSEIRDRLTIPLACLAVSFVAAPLAARSRRGGRSFSFAIGGAVLLAYYTLYFLTQPRDIYPLWSFILLGMAPAAALIAVGMIALYRVDRI